MQNKPSILASITSPLHIAALALLVAQPVLIAVGRGAGDMATLVSIVGVTLLALFTVGAVIFLAIRHPDLLKPHVQATTESSTAENSSITFDRLSGEITSTIDQLTADDMHLARHYRDHGDINRLLDGLYSGLLYAALAIPTGRIEPHLFGNMLEWDGASLRVRYFLGTYSDEVICRTFPLTGPRRGIASEAVTTGEIQCRDSMENELLERRESLLKSMVSIPVAPAGDMSLEAGAIAVVNINSTREGITAKRTEDLVMRKRARELAALVQSVNIMRADLA